MSSESKKTLSIHVDMEEYTLIKEIVDSHRTEFTTMAEFIKHAVFKEVDDILHGYYTLEEKVIALFQDPDFLTTFTASLSSKFPELEVDFHNLIKKIRDNITKD